MNFVLRFSEKARTTGHRDTEDTENFKEQTSYNSSCWFL